MYLSRYNYGTDIVASTRKMYQFDFKQFTVTEDKTLCGHLYFSS